MTRSHSLISTLLMLAAVLLTASTAVARPIDPEQYRDVVPPPPDLSASHVVDDDFLRAQLPWLSAMPIFEEIADFAFHSTLLGDAPDELWQIRASIGSRVWAPVGLDARRGDGFFSLDASLGLGFIIEPWIIVQLRSNLSAPLPLSDEQPSVEGLEWLAGDHRLRIQSGIGDISTGALGADIEADARLRHAPDAAPSNRVRDGVGPAGHHDTEVDARLWLRRGMGSDGAWVLPIGVGWRNLDYWRDDTSTSRLQTQHISSGVGIRPYSRESSGWVEFLGLTWSRTEYEHNAITPPCPGGDCGKPGVSGAPRLAGVNRLDMRAFHTEDLNVLLDDGVWLNPTLSIGGSWLWDEASGREASLFTMTGGTTARFRHGSAGYAFSRDAGLAPDGGYLLANWRFELLGEFFIEEAYMGGAFRGAFNWSEDLERDFESQTFASNHTLHTEWFFELFDGGTLGVYHLANHGISPEAESWDLWEEDPRWRHQIGGFFRWGFAE